MNINEANDFFKSLITGTDKKSELKVYESFIAILSDLKNKDLTEKQLQSIEEKLDTLKLKANPQNRKKHFKRKYTEFTTYLKDEFSLITEGYYTGIGMVFGMMFGTSLGIVFGTSFEAGTGTAIGLSMGTGIGMTIGMMFGAAKDSEAKKQGRVLKTKLD